ncbi:lipoxygenase family protein [Alkalinema pantanalense CENA528]|uniref:lipoxygenase family protein n=1 Tax=Alkalinema pantanalense TaxID=1620705 RepID=UPI003D6E0CAC
MLFSLDPLMPSLPQDDPCPDGRAACLAASRAIYQFDTSYADVGFVQQVPIWDQFSPDYLATFAKLQGIVYANQAVATVQQCQWAPEGGFRFAVNQMRSRLQDRELQSLYGPSRDPRVPTFDERAPLSITDYEQLFQLIAPPPNRYRWQEDWAFAWQRIAGTAPILIRSVQEALPENLPVTEAHMQRATGGRDSLAAALAEGRLFIVDFSILQGIAAGITDHYRKYLYAPIVLLRWDPQATCPPGGPPGRLLPVAIQCGQVPNPQTPILTPADGVAWEMAKVVVQSADSNYHGVVEHLGRCHMMAAWIALYTFRHLAPSHPLRVLLTPHFQFTLAVNVPTRSLLSPGGRTPRLQAVSLESAIQLVKRGFAEFDWNALTPPTDFSRRGVLDRDVLPVYPYRDDALPQWEAIRAFVGDYVALYYSSDRDVTEDFELQDWFRHMGSGEGAQIKGMGRDGQVATREDLADLVAQIIFRVTVFHALINYTVFPAMAFVPNMPTAIYGPAPTSSEGYQPDDLLPLLPPMAIALDTLSDVYVVGHLRCNQLGQYAPCHFVDRRVRPLVVRLQNRLAQIEQEIQSSNQYRLAPFEILLPSNIPQSIHI